MVENLTAFLESQVDLEHVVATEELSIEWAALHRFDAELADNVLDNPLLVHDEIVDALAVHDMSDEIDPEAVDVYIQGVTSTGKSVDR